MQVKQPKMSQPAYSWEITVNQPSTVAARLVESARDRAVIEMRAGNCDAAIVSLVGVIESTGDWTCQFWLAVAYLSSGKWADARRQFLHVAERCPNAELRKYALSMLLVVERSDSSNSSDSSYDQGRNK